MLYKLYDGWHWIVASVNSFETEHWVLAFVVLGVIGMICLRGLGVRGAR